ncbi:hypothetical protein [Paraburkholderia susongensis]|uniref:Uncharacterized protein n=1 Tax=Paraburkholderia susongensis TaxID=1515439 RepID=A0A1X7LV98_9BURK|nr:hypothetical protein [Paraburkholderia susongensis]SMG57816.1 hypothetical protein SAMN06265784_11072 [Paraburkholderia susongensis]
MSYQDIDKEIAHLEVVFGLISTRDRFPLSYWHRRLHALNRLSMVPVQRERVAQLESTLRSVGAAQDQDQDQDTASLHSIESTSS